MTQKSIPVNPIAAEILIAEMPLSSKPYSLRKASVGSGIQSLLIIELRQVSHFINIDFSG